ncbi:GntR family transcriptional regulator [Amycolatopsis antarctica]|uniref:GntR family transcriptional regulator n=1 Tax=Amycolatopsis antarctica TaxID=1854586 RepID=A0A263D9Z8_9PSEU|nr:FadR/GntR family transcriptional regulator [Amycolatopsis antarctica]OZM75344.1 GntR family transcriptional regulator [Amycolatopsis antarctica]
MLARLGTSIVEGTLPPGSVLRLEELQERFGASRTVAREVVRALETMGLTESRRRVGVTVRAPGHWNHYDPRLIRWQLDGRTRTEALRVLTELRRAVEPTAAGLAAHRATAAQRTRLRELGTLLATTAKARDLDTFLRHDVAFHHLLLTASGNPMFGQLSEVVREVLAGRTGHGLMPPEPEPEAVALHLEVAEAVHAGDAPRAERAMRDIVVQAGTEMNVLLDSAPGAPGGN